MSRLDTRFDLFDRVIFGQGRATSVKLPNGRLRYTISEPIEPESVIVKGRKISDAHSGGNPTPLSETVSA